MHGPDTQGQGKWQWALEALYLPRACPAIGWAFCFAGGDIYAESEMNVSGNETAGKPHPTGRDGIQAGLNENRNRSMKMKNNQKYLSLLMVQDDACRLQERCCAVLEDEITERHDPIIGELEKVFRKAVCWKDDDMAIELAWQQVDLAIQDMHREMVLASFVAGIQYGVGLIGSGGDGNGRLVGVPVNVVPVEA